jgi:hypothetical protein
LRPVRVGAVREPPLPISIMGDWGEGDFPG